jgi:predicted nuclease of restriction endonuclease-like RecB superfamily
MADSFDVYCSVPCLVSAIKNTLPLDADRCVESGVFFPHDPEPSGLECYSTLLDRNFRSFFEVIVAEVLTLKYGLTLYYEPFEIRVQIGSRERIYVPDFFVDPYGVFVEVKGEWRNGGKRKCTTTLKQLGPQRLILIGSYMRDAFLEEKRSWKNIEDTSEPCRQAE